MPGLYMHTHFLVDSPLKISPSREVEDADLCVEQRDLKKWLGNLPDTVVQVPILLEEYLSILVIGSLFVEIRF